MNNYPIPFKNGNQVFYPYDWPYSSRGYNCDRDIVWKNNYEFYDTIIYKGYLRGSRSVYFTFEIQSSRKEVTVFLKDFEELIPQMVNGKVTGTFSFRRRGQNYGCFLVPFINANLKNGEKRSPIKQNKMVNNFKDQQQS